MALDGGQVRFDLLVKGASAVGKVFGQLFVEGVLAGVDPGVPDLEAGAVLVGIGEH